jgi:hypothetical protein
VWRHSSFWESKGRRFLLRLALAYVIVPLTAPILLVLLMIRGTRYMLFFDWVGIFLLYAIFSFVAMVVLGIPLLVLYSRFHWSGFFAFIVGGAVCAATTYALVVRGQMQRDQLVLFTLFGIVEGLAFRLFLFGGALHARPVGSLSR